ncbi:retrovirus-related pol polyprotein from transposon TNT 1-94, partial [Tanacetum coccineum]
LAKQGLIKGLPKLKYTEDNLCSACQVVKSKKDSHPQKSEPVKFFKTNDEALEIIIKILKQVQVSHKATVRYLRINNGIEFINQTLRNYTKNVGTTHHTSTARTPQQNGVVERHNRTLVEAARTMLIFSKSLFFLWAEVVATACYTKNRSLIHPHYNKTPYELLRDRPELQGLTSGHISSGLVQNQAASTSAKPPTKNDWDLPFQPMFDEYFKPLSVVSTTNSAATLPPPDTVTPPNRVATEYGSESVTS